MVKINLLSKKSSIKLLNIAWLVNKMLISGYPRCRYIIYDNGSEFKLNIEYLCVVYGVKHNPTMIKNPQAKCNFGALSSSLSTNVMHS